MDNNNNTRRSRRVSRQPFQPPLEYKIWCSRFSSVRHCDLNAPTVPLPGRIVNATGRSESAPRAVTNVDWSADVLMEPGSRYWSLVPKRTVGCPTCGGLI